MTPSGEFTLSSAWDFIRDKRPLHDLSRALWHKCTLRDPFLLFVWLRQWLPVDVIMQTRGGELVSVCWLCRNSVESLSHLFIDCIVVRRVWEYFAGIFDIHLPRTSEVQILIQYWRYSTAFHGRWSNSFAAAAVYLLVWRSRNEASGRCDFC